MNLVRVMGGLALMAGGLFLAWDLVSHSGFDKIEKPFTGPFGVIAPLLFFGGLWLVRGQLRLSRPVRLVLAAGLVLQALALLPFVQPRIIAPTPGHAGVGLVELLSVAMIFGGLISFVVLIVLILTAKAD